VPFRRRLRIIDILCAGATRSANIEINVTMSEAGLSSMSADKHFVKRDGAAYALTVGGIHNG
jgi:hypothetical protein